MKSAVERGAAEMTKALILAIIRILELNQVDESVIAQIRALIK